MGNLIKNEYIINGNITQIVINSRKYGIVRVLIDTEDLDKVKKYNWSLMASRKNVNYIQSNNRILLHRYLLDCPNGMQVDHINRNIHDNRKCNLRVVTSAENAKNRSGYGRCKYKFLSITKRKDRNYILFEVKFPNLKHKTFANINEAKAYYIECLLNYGGNL